MAKDSEYNGTPYWNALPVHVRTEEDIEKFKTHVKTLLADNNQFKQTTFKYKVRDINTCIILIRLLYCRKMPHLPEICWVKPGGPLQLVQKGWGC